MKLMNLNLTTIKEERAIIMIKLMKESYTIETVNEICETLKKDVDKISHMVNKYPDNYSMDDLVSRLIDIETRLYEIWR